MVKESASTNTDRIYLTGFMGSGMIRVGRILPRHYGRPFVDLEDSVVKEARMTIPEIFRLRGEAAFKRLEARIMHRFKRGKWIAALCGGALVDPATRDLLTAAGTVVYLRAELGTLAARLKGQRAGCPLLAGDEPLERRITSLLDTRNAVYSCARWVQDTDDLSPEQVADSIYERAKASPDEHDHNS